MTNLTYKAIKSRAPIKTWLTPTLIFEILLLPVRKVLCLFGWLICCFIIPAQGNKYEDFCTKKLEQDPTKRKEKVEKERGKISPAKSLWVKTCDNYYLHTIEIKPQDDNEQQKEIQSISNPQGKNIKIKRIIYFMENSSFHEDPYKRLEMTKDANETGATAVAFNYRGVGENSERSTGVWRLNGLLKDGVAQVQRLLDDGFKMEEILLKGGSIGAYVATMVKAHFDKTKKNKDERGLFLFSDRSLSSLTSFVIGHYLKWVKEKLTGWLTPIKFLAFIFTFVLFILTKTILVLTGCEFHAGWNYRLMDKSEKAHLHVKGDPTMGKYERLSSSVFVENIETFTSRKSHEFEPNYDISDKEAIDPHCAPLEYLVQKNGGKEITGDEYFQKEIVEKLNERTLLS